MDLAKLISPFLPESVYSNVAECSNLGALSKHLAKLADDRLDFYAYLYLFMHIKAPVDDVARNAERMVEHQVTRSVYAIS